jgi:hypothetical protein
MQANNFDRKSIVVADYKEQRIPRYRENALIAALPLSQGDEAVMESLTLKPEFSVDQREWETHERFHQLLGLSNFMVPMEAHVRLARVLDSMIREGYVGRKPLSKEHLAIYHDIYRRQMDGETFRQQASTITPQLSTSLIGLSGMGKTTTAKRFLARFPQVIHHPELDVYQIPYLHIEMSSDGKSIKGLAAAILQQIDTLIPDATYYQDYFGKGRIGADALMRSVARVMNKHCVGLLVVDEVQNLGNSPKGQQVLMTELVGACNELKVPMLFIGTNKAHKVLSLDFRQGRRAVGYGLGNWGALSLVDEDGNPGEWVDFMTVLWEYQWTRDPVPMDNEMLRLFFECTQGVIDLTIKLFVASQARAMVDGSECLTHELVADVFASDMKLIHPMVQALARNDLKTLMKYEDISPPALEDMVDDMARRYRGKRTFAASVRPGDEDFVARLAVAGIALGLDARDAEHIAVEIEREGNVNNMLDAAKKLGEKVTPPKRTKSSKADSPAPMNFDKRPQDYRGAIAAATTKGSTVFEKLFELGMAKPAEELVLLN